MQQALPSSLGYHRVLRAAGIGIWVFLGLPILDSATRRGESFTPVQWTAWLMLFAVFGPAFWFSSTTRARSLTVRVFALVLQTVAALGMTLLQRDYFVGCLLVLVSWQLALHLPLRVVAGWVLADSALWIYLLQPSYHMGWRWSASGAFFGFQVIAIITAAIANSEALARQNQAHINAELVATRELLRESSKAGERLRIARELHDMLGHHLTALCLHLEAALHSTTEQSHTIIEKALATSKQLLQDVRSVVSALHEADDIDLHAALQSLGENVPRIKLHVSLASDLRMMDSIRAHAVLRCVQEITTNTLKHSDSSNLWIDLRLEKGAIEIEARDDGRLVSPAKSGTGISSMQKRLEELGGGLTLSSGAQTGFALRAWLPVKKPLEAQ